ncbi:MAG: hypothetical protein ACTTH5_02615 [Wolinella sp.]
MEKTEEMEEIEEMKKRKKEEFYIHAALSLLAGLIVGVSDFLLKVDNIGEAIALTAILGSIILVSIKSHVNNLFKKEKK